MYKVLGYLNIALVVVITAPYWLRKANQWFFHGKNQPLSKLAAGLRRAHKWLGAALLASILAHGYLAMGGQLRLNTGALAGASFLLTMLFGLLFFLLKKPPLLKVHRALALVSVLLAILHLLAPNLLSRLSA